MPFPAFDTQTSFTWHPTRRTHLLHAGVAILLLSTSPVTIGVPLTPSALLVTAMSLACLPLASRLPAAGAAASLAVAWFAANSPYDLGGISVVLPWGLCIMLLGRGLRRDMIYILAFATTLAHLSATPTWYLGLIQTATFGAPCMVIGEVIRHHRLQASAAEQERRHKLDQQRRLVVSELHDTVVRDLSHAVMIAEQARLADPHNTHLNQELAAIITPVRTAVEQLRRSLKAMSAAEGRRLPPPTGSLTPTTPDRHHPHRPGNPRAPRRPPDHSRHRPARQPQHRPGPPPTTRPHHRRAHQQRRQVHTPLQHRHPHHRDGRQHPRVHVHQPHLPHPTVQYHHLIAARPTPSPATHRIPWRSTPHHPRPQPLDHRLQYSSQQHATSKNS